MLKILKSFKINFNYLHSKANKAINPKDELHPPPLNPNNPPLLQPPQQFGV